MITEMDFLILNAVQRLRSPFFDFLAMYTVPATSQAAILWIAVCAALIVRKRDRITGIKALTAVILGSVIFTLIVKNITARERPFNQAGALLDSASLLIPPPSDVYSFPSGHSVSSFAAAFAVFMHKRVFGTVCLAAAALIAFSRLYLYVHFPSDVICGALFGILCAVAADRIIDRITDKKNENKLSDNT